MIGIDIPYGVSGVYLITNLVNGKVYVGSSACIRSRWSGHRCRTNESPVARALRRYGTDQFTITVLERCAVESLIAREQRWLDHYHSYDPEIGYNIAAKAEEPLRGLPVSPEQRRILSERGKRRVGPLNTFYGKKHTPESRRAMALARIGVNTGSANPHYGKRHSPEARRAISEAGRGRDNGCGKPVEQIDLKTGEVLKIWPSARAACKGLGRTACHIIEVCNGKPRKLPDGGLSNALRSCAGFGWRWVSTENDSTTGPN